MGVSKGIQSLWPPEAIMLLGKIKMNLLYFSGDTAETTGLDF